MNPAIAWTEEPTSRPDRRKIRARIGGLHCSLCTGTIEKALGRMPGVDKVAVSLTHEQALVEYDPQVARPEALLETLRDIGYTVSDPRKLRAFEEEERDLVREGRRFVAAVVLSVASIALIANPTEHWFSALPALVCLSLGALVFLVLRPSGLWNAVAGFSGLVVMAATLLVLNGRGPLTSVAPRAVRLLAVHPDPAGVVLEDRDVGVAAGGVKIGDLVRIRPGGRIPVDGTVVSGHSGVDQSFVTGEPIPVDTREGDAVVGGSINGTGTLLVRVTAIGEESFLQRVVREVEDARALKPGMLHLVDRILRVYTPSVLVVAALSFVGWMLGAQLIVGHPDLGRAVFAALSVLVMGYPCAVGISAPLSIVRGAGEAADHGILMRTGEAFQTYRLVTHVVLDKTGTLTEGKPVVREMEARGVTESELLALAAAAESSSEHPLAAAVVKAAFEQEAVPPDVAAFEALPGKGVIASIGGHEVVVGNPRFLGERAIDLRAFLGRFATLEEQGPTVVAVARGGRCLGILALGGVR